VDIEQGPAATAGCERLLNAERSAAGRVETLLEGERREGHRL
jgi:hypothetical protein